MMPVEHLQTKDLAAITNQNETKEMDKNIPIETVCNNWEQNHRKILL